MRKIRTILLSIPLLLFFANPAGAAEKEDQAWQDESIYYIMVDRFMNGVAHNDQGINIKDGEAFHGGDLQGVIEQLDYIKDMGFTSICLSPIMDNQKRGYHGFWVEDFMKTEEHFGTMKDAERLVQEAHKRNMKVIFEFPVNFTGNEHPWLNDSNKENWYKESSTAGEDDHLHNSWLKGLPELNLDNKEVQNYLFKAADYWIKNTNVDGFKLERKGEIPAEFIQVFASHVNSTKNGFFLLSHSENMIGARLHDGYYRTASEAFSDAGNSLQDVNEVWNMELNIKGSVWANYIDNLQTLRFAHRAVTNQKNPATRLNLALTYTFTAPGLPIVTYGTEVPLDPGADQAPKMMDFKAANEDLSKLLEKLNAMRQEFPALTKGDFKQLYHDSGFAVFKRTYQNNTMIIAINNDTKTRAITIQDLPEQQQLRGLLLDGVVRQSQDGGYKLGMDRETADVFVVENDQGYNWLFIGFVGGVLGLFVVAVAWLSRKSKSSKEDRE
ncbi:alpha-amylase family glycosyl hydrolase [Halobacillus salinarum]|uniref:Alpha-amylase family glycosyl hydrolase n=1 Tax=Halobacillus salinarum TaxID=2932257 RepID=A0ABY4EHC7_9BACI|nr:alpha-amylase family glycosyl hydrolase [Halobacillus salinarum]UOQ43468.1 alpha-amylase family glycosyl hydrolase [Halobacillus salinarum]